MGIYDRLLVLSPSPVLALTRAIAVGCGTGPAAGLAEMDRLAAEPALAGHPYRSAARAAFLEQLGRTPKTVERRFLAARLEALD